MPLTTLTPSYSFLASGYTVVTRSEVTPGRLTLELTLTWGGGANEISQFLVMLDGLPVVSRFGPWSLAGAVESWSVANPSAGTLVVTITLNTRAMRLRPGTKTVGLVMWGKVSGNDYANLAAHVEYPQPIAAQPIAALAQTPVGGVATPAFVRAGFEVTKEVIDSGQLTAAQVKAVGFNCLQTHVWNDPAANTAHGTSYSTWLSAWEAYFLPLFDWLRANGFLAFAIGDSFYRDNSVVHPATGMTTRAWFDATSWVPQAVTHVSEVLWSYRDVFVGVEAVDEVDLAFGSTTTTADRFVTAWRAASGGTYIPVSWPGWVSNVATWVNTSRADYASRYIFQIGGGWADKPVRAVYPPGSARSWSLPQTRLSFDQMVSGVPPQMPVCFQLSAVDLQWTKNAPGGEFAPNADLITGGPWSPTDVVAQAGLIAAYGGRAARVYYLDTFPKIAERQGAAIGSVNLERGFKPGTPLWDAVKVALNWLKNRESRLLTGHYVPPLYEDGWVVGEAGSLKWAVNTNETPRPCPFPGMTVLTDSGGEKSYRPGADVPAGGVASTA